MFVLLKQILTFAAESIIVISKLLREISKYYNQSLDSEMRIRIQGFRDSSPAKESNYLITNPKPIPYFINLNLPLASSLSVL